MTSGAPFTTAQIKRAGRRLRHAAESEEPDTDTARAWEIVDWFRRQHQYPLAKAAMGLRAFCDAAGVSAEVSQRLKRMPTTVHKLVRHPAMSVTTMHDLGGCRAVVDSLADVRRLEQRIRRQRGRRQRSPVVVYDYIAQPRPSGYRGVHLIVAYSDRGGIPRKIEVQLRTRRQHTWAAMVERTGDTLGVDLKGGAGSAEVREALATLADEMAAADERGTGGSETVDHASGRHRGLRRGR